MTLLNKKNLLHQETILHMKRCSIVARDFADYLKLDIKNKKELIKCALLHDIGKITIPPHILYKKERLTDNEFNIIKSHVDMDKRIIFHNNNIKEAILYHHERADGNGYKKINIATLTKYPKIVSLIDVYDVMSNKRCYKNTVSNKAEIISEIEHNIGTQFDKFYGYKFVDFLKSYI